MARGSRPGCRPGRYLVSPGRRLAQAEMTMPAPKAIGSIAANPHAHLSTDYDLLSVGTRAGLMRRAGINRHPVESSQFRAALKTKWWNPAEAAGKTVERNGKAAERGTKEAGNKAERGAKEGRNKVERGAKEASTKAERGAKEAANKAESSAKHHERQVKEVARAAERNVKAVAESAQKLKDRLSAATRCQCVDCPSGQYQPGGPGHYPEGCRQCGPGHFQGSGGQAHCNRCAQGTYASGHGSTSCPSCPRGSYNKAPGSASCLQCEPGRFQGAHSDHKSCSSCAVGHYQDAYGSSGCTKCPVNAFQPKTGSTLCFQCPEGSSTSGKSGQRVCHKCGTGYGASGGSDCLACPSGKFGAAHTGLCISCPAGKWQDRAAQSACHACGAGTFGSAGHDNTSSKHCERCPIGYTSPAGVSVCTACDAGRFGDRLNSCAACPLGKFAAGRGSQFCDQCSEGSFAGSRGLERCADCAKGRHQAKVGQSTCTVCDAGQYQPQVAEDHCVLCAGGTYQAHAGATDCVLCDSGKYQDVDGASSCEACSPGKYQDVMGEMDCDACAPGKNTASAGNSACGACSAGKHQPAFGQAECVSCAAGRYQVATGMADCDLCMPGTFNDSRGAVECTACKAGRFEVASGASQCTACPSGQYTTGPSQGLQGLECADCPTGKWTYGLTSKCINMGPTLGTASATIDSWQHTLSAKTHSKDCSALPQSMNGASKPSGCAGAVWTNGVPAKRYCNGDHKTTGDQVFPWWSHCCTWEDNKCVPKPVFTKTATKTEELTSIDTRTNRQTDPSIKEHAHPTMHNAPLHANKLNQARGGLSPYITAKFAALRAGSSTYAPARTCTALTCSHDTHNVGLDGHDTAKSWTSVRVTHQCKARDVAVSSTVKKSHYCREKHCQRGHFCAVEVNGDCSCIESHPYDRIPNCATQDGPKCNACDAGHVLEENECKKMS